MNVGATTTLTITAAVTISGTALVNTAQVWRADQIDPNSTPGNNKPNEDDQDSVIVFAGGVADLALTKTASVTTLAFGSNVVFTITVTNAGPSVATGVTVKDLMPAGLAYMSHGAGAYAPLTGIWTIGTLNVGATTTLTVEASMTSAALPIVNLAQVWTADQVDPDSTPGNSNPGEDDQDTVFLLPRLMLTIISEHGTGTPPVGVYSHGYETVLTNLISGVVPFGGTQYVNVGWSMIGNDPVAGLTNTMTMLHTNDAVLTWQWTTNYALTLTAVHGTIVNATPGWKPAGGTYAPTPVADFGYDFDHWEVNGVNQGSSVPLAVTMDEAKNIIAIFSPSFVAEPVPIDATITWLFDPRKGCFLGTVTIRNSDLLRVLAVPILFEVESTEWHWLRYPTGRDGKTGMDYIDISAAIGAQLPGIGNGDLVFDPGESVTITGIELMGRRTPAGLVMAVWAAAPDVAALPIPDPDGIWQPSEWAYIEWPWAYDSASGDWYWFLETDTQWIYADAPGLGWGLLPQSGLAYGWSYWDGDWAYDAEMGAWCWRNTSDTQWVVNMRTGQWSLLGQAAPRIY